VLYKENRVLHRKLDSLLKQARTNEKKQELFDSFGLEVIGSSTPAELRDMLLTRLQVRFKLRDVVLCVVDCEEDAEHLFFGYDEEARLLFDRRMLFLRPGTDLEKIQSLSSCPVLGTEVLKNYSWMLDGLGNHQQHQSAAFLPLIRGSNVLGALLLISSDYDRYQSGHATDFLQKLSAMVAVALENCLNHQRLKEIGYQDVLTLAHNRRYFDQRIKDEIARSLRKQEDLACLFLDVDHFKKVNDTYGHHVGDMVLMQMVSIIKEQVRACDIVARYGGEEFVVALPGTGLERAKEIAERLRVSVYAAPFTYNDDQVEISISVGLTSIGLPGDDEKQDIDVIATRMLEHADKALYTAKENGRNQVVIYPSGK
jgi:diguanylate cyclase (GGDEF)-like protein